MSWWWKNDPNCISPHSSSFSSDFLKVLQILKTLQGSRKGAKGATFRRHRRRMIKHFSLHGDVKSKVLDSLKYGVKMNYILKRKNKFSLILPASSIHLAPSEDKREKAERIQSVYPPMWYSNQCNNICSSVGADDTCCGKRKRSNPNLCSQQDADEDEPENRCALCKKKKKSQSSNSCNICAQNKAPESCPPPCPPPPCEPSSSCFKRSNPCPPLCPATTSEECLPCLPRKKSKTCPPESNSSEE